MPEQHIHSQSAVRPHHTRLLFRKQSEATVVRKILYRAFGDVAILEGKNLLICLRPRNRSLDVCIITKLCDVDAIE